MNRVLSGTHLYHQLYNKYINITKVPKKFIKIDKNKNLLRKRSTYHPGGGWNCRGLKIEPGWRLLPLAVAIDMASNGVRWRQMAWWFVRSHPSFFLQLVDWREIGVLSPDVIKLSGKNTYGKSTSDSHVIHMWRTCDFTTGDFLTTTCGLHVNVHVATSC